MNLIEIINRMSNDNILNRSFNDQGDTSKPCSASFINELEKVIITNEDVDNGLCCAICQEEFKLGDNVIKLPCKDPHYFHYESPEDQCGGILPWLKDNNSCPVCREEFPEEEPEIPIPDENFDSFINGSNTTVNTDTDINPEVDDQINQQIEEMIQRLFTIRHITQPRPQYNHPFNPRNTIYIPMIIPVNNYLEDEDPDLQEAIRQSLES
jgi:hypothetical protein